MGMDQNEVITVLVLLTLVALVVAIWLFDRRRRRVGVTVSSSVFDAVEEIFHPESANRSESTEIQGELPPKSVLPVREGRVPPNKE